MYDVVIIGAGPAGLTAGVYTGRAGLKTLIVEKAAPGGKVFVTHLIENYPGIDSISGRELASQMHKHALKFGVEYEFGDVLEIKDNQETKTIVTNMKEYETRSVIIATGTENRKLGIVGEEEFLGRGVSYCAICDGNFFKDQEVVVVGGGNSALEEALYLSEICKSVKIIHRRQGFRAEEYTVNKVKENNKIELILDHVVTKVSGDEKVSSIEVKNVLTEEINTIDTKGVFFYVGLDPVTEAFNNLGILDAERNIVVDENMKTKVDKVYAAGDVTPKHLRQVVTATSDGAIAAQAIINELK